MKVTAPIEVRAAREQDLDAVIALEAQLMGRGEAATMRSTARRYLEREGSIALVATGPAGFEGYLLGEVRAFEFGSEECGWVFAVGVHPEHAREGVGSALLERARHEFQALGVSTVRTMVRRNDVPLQSFFRRNRFVGGPFVQLELELELGPANAASDTESES